MSVRVSTRLVSLSILWFYSCLVSIVPSVSGPIFNEFCTLQDLLLRIPIHEIAAICYIRDDDQHILGIKFGKWLGNFRQLS